MSSDFENRTRGEERRYPNGERMREEDIPVAEQEPPTDIPYTPSIGRFVPAIVLVAIGAIFLLANMGLFNIYDVWRYWPLILIVNGAFRLPSRDRGAKSQAAVMVVVGAVFLLFNLGLVHITFRLLWPLALVGVGLYMFYRGFGNAPIGSCRNTKSRAKRRGGRRDTGRDAGIAYDDIPRNADPIMASPSLADADDRLQNWVLFGGVKRVITSHNFKGGELLAIFGGIEVDLRLAQIVDTGRPVVIEANAAFGGVSIKVPDTWRVAVRGVGIFGGYQDEAVKIRQPDPSAPLLIVAGYAAFGGVVIE